MKHVITLFSVLALLAMPLLSVFAQEGVGIKIQPAIIEERVDPGQTFSGSIKVTNLDPTAKDFSLLARDILRVGPEGQPVFAEENQPTGFGLSSWVRIAEKKISLAPGEEREVKFSVVIPDNASPGSHFGGIFLSSNPERLREIGAAIGYQVGTILSLRITGDVLEEARIREFRTEKGIYSDANVDFYAKIENLGNTLVKPRGPLEVVNMFGKKVATLTMNEEAASVFPRSDREFKINWTGEGFAFGRHQATIALLYGEDGRKTISGSISFWILPLNILLPIIIGLLVVLGGTFFGLRFYINRRLRELQGNAPVRARTTVKLPFGNLVLITLLILVFVAVFLGLLFLLFSN